MVKLRRGPSGVNAHRCRKSTALDPVPFWLQRINLFRWFNVTTVSFPSCAYSYPSMLAASPDQVSRLSAFIPASRIEDQSLPWGMRLNPSPGAVGIAPTPESSSHAERTYLLSSCDQSPGSPGSGFWSTDRTSQILLSRGAPATLKNKVSLSQWLSMYL